MVDRLPVLGITMGDPAGVGPEIIARALARPEVAASARAVVIGDRSVMAATLGLLRSPLMLHAVKAYAKSTKSVNGKRTGHEPPADAARSARRTASKVAAHDNLGAVR